MIVGIPQETFAGEFRVALIPDAVSALSNQNVEILVESAAGEAAGFTDALYADRGARIAADRDEIFSHADVVLQVRTFGANPQAGRDDLARTRAGQVFIGSADPLTAGPQLREMASAGVEIGTHGAFYRVQVGRSMAGVAADLARARRRIAGELGAP